MIRNGLQELYARHHGFVWRVCWRYVQNRADADDLAHDVLVKAARGWTRFTGECAVTSWLYRVAVNHCCDHLRKNRLHADARERAGLVPGAGTWPCGAVVSGEGAGGAGDDARDVAAEVLEALRGTLQGPERHIVYLRFDVGLPQQGIARITGLPRAVVRRRLARILHRAALLFHDSVPTLPPCGAGGSRLHIRS